MAEVVLGAWVLLHVAILLLPGVAVAARLPRQEPMTAILLGAGVAAEASFFLFFLSPGLGRAFTYATVAGSVVAVVTAARRRALGHLVRPAVLAPFGFVAALALVVIGSLTLYGGADHPAVTSNNRYMPGLPVDNVMPFVLGDRIVTGEPTDPFVAEWLSSDRPPLQSGAMSYAFPLQFGMTNEAHYQALSAVANLLWIAPLWLLLRRLRVPERLAGAAVAVAAFSGISVFYGAYVWPKGLSAAFAILALAEALDRRAATAGLAMALGLLSHGGALFVLLPLIPIVLTVAALARARPRALAHGLAVAALAGAVLYAPWAAYVRWHAPPGNRLLKWHLAGVIPIDERSTSEAVWDAYTKRPLRQIADNKWSNLEMLISKDRVFGDVFPVMGGKTSIARVRGREFGHLANGLGVTWLGVPAAAWCAWRTWRTRRASASADAAALVSAFAAGAMIVWALILFGPQSTLPHAGSMAVPLLLMAGLALFVGAVDERLAHGLAVLAAARVARVWLLAEPVNPAPGRPGAAVVLLLGTSACAGVAAVVYRERRP